MRKVQIGSMEFVSLIVLYVISNDLIRGEYFKILKQDILISQLIGLVGSFIILSLYFLLFKRMNYSNFEEILKKLLGNSLSKLLLLIYAFYFISLAITDLKDISHLTHIYLLSTTPLYIVLFIILFSVYFALLLGLEATSRISNIFFFTAVIVFITFSILMLTSNKINFTNFLPFLEVGKKTVLVHGYYSSYSLPFGQLFVFVIFYKYLKNKNSTLKLTILAELLIGFMQIFIVGYCIVILGPIAMQYTHSPPMLISKRIDIAQFIQRFDLITINVLAVASYIKQFVLIYAATYCTKHVFNKIKFRVIATLFVILVYVGSLYLFTNYLDFVNSRIEFFIPYISPIFELYIPILLLLLSLFIKSDKKKKNKIKNDSVIEIQ